MIFIQPAVKQAFGERLKNVISDLKYTGNEFASDVGLGSSQVYKILRGDTLPGVKLCTEVHQKFPEINWDFMITGRGKPFLEGEEIESGLQGVKAPPASAVRKKPVAADDTGNFQELYQQCRQLVDTKDMLIEMQARRIAELEGQKTKKSREAG